MDFARFDKRPIVVAVAGPNGAGKTTFFHAHLERAALPLVNADVLARELDIDAYAAARLADVIRRELVKRQESFVFETVLSDPVGDRVAFLKRAAESGYTVVLCFIGIAGPDVSEDRVSMRVSQGGHEVPHDKLQSRYPRTLANLKLAIQQLPHVLIYDNDDLSKPYRQVAVFEQGCLLASREPISEWLRPLLPSQS
ncbi:MAG: zeta toxin family protein [Planctomycetota bacterium]